MAHDGTYILHIKNTCEEIEPGSLFELDGDTAVTRESWASSIRAVGAVIEACK